MAKTAYNSRPPLERYKIDPATGCWGWTGRKRKGYGYFTTGSHAARNLKEHRASRYFFAHHRHSLDASSMVLHRCDNPACVNPDHLFLGDHAANMADMTSKRRRNGELSNSHILTEKQVTDIRADSRGHAELGRVYGVTRQCIWNIRNSKSWAHLSGDDGVQETSR